MDAQAAEALLLWAEDARTRLTGLHAKLVFTEISEQYDALKSALQWFVHNDRPDQARRLVTSLVPFWMATKRLDEGTASLEAAVSMNGGAESHRGRALFDAGYLAFWKGDYDRSSSLQNEALALGRKNNDPTVTALALAGLARIALGTDVSQARELCREAIALTEGTHDRLGRSSAMHVLGVAAQMAGDLQEAREVMSQRIAMAEEQGHFAIISSEAGNLSMVERQLGNLERAEALGRQALDIDVKRGDQMAIAWKVNGLAAVAAARGQFVRAATLIGIADATMLAAGGAWPPDEKQQYDGTVAALTGALDTANVERARATGSSMSMPAAVAFALGSDTTKPQDEND